MLIYKIFRPEEWDELIQNGETLGAPVDRADGYVHFSTGAQVAETCRKHFAKDGDLVLAVLEADDLGPALKWEKSRGGERFPHLYRALTKADIFWAKDLPRALHGHIFPDGVV